ncbi:hypothetical protein [Nocardia paucivorans]|nr:hypothetical protein [Nocardia paucivorans]
MLLYERELDTADRIALDGGRSQRVGRAHLTDPVLRFRYRERRLEG